MIVACVGRLGEPLGLNQLIPVNGTETTMRRINVPLRQRLNQLIPVNGTETLLQLASWGGYLPVSIN